LVQGAGIARLLYGPFHQKFCFWLIILRRALTTRLFLLLDAITVIRFIFIFCLQNPGVFNDNFWNLFINLWIAGLCFLNNFINASLPKLTLFDYTTCIGLPPFKQMHSIFANFTIEIASIFLQLILYLLINCYKSKHLKDLGKKGHNHKSTDLASIEKHSLLSFSFNISFLLSSMFAITFFIVRYSMLSLFDVKSWSSLFVPFTFLVLPSIQPFIIAAVIICSNPDMRKAVVREAKINFWNPILQNHFVQAIYLP
jgi:hypothetical protein